MFGFKVTFGNTGSKFDLSVGDDVTLNADVGDDLHIETDVDDDMKVKTEMGAIPAGAAVKIGEVALLASAWKGGESLYSQVVQIKGVTARSQVDLTPSVEQLVVFYEKDLTFVTENEDGVVTVYAIGQKPTNDYTIQVTITEVSV